MMITLLRNTFFDFNIKKNLLFSANVQTRPDQKDSTVSTDKTFLNLLCPKSFANIFISKFGFSQLGLYYIWSLVN